MIDTDPMTDKYRVTQTRYLGDSLMAAAGEVVYLYGANDEGVAQKESEKTGRLHVSVTKKISGEPPHFTIPQAHLLKIEKPQWP